MSSRKSSRSSTRESTSSKERNDEMQANINTTLKNISQSFMIGMFAISVIVQGSILYYLYNLEDADCNCIRDWRHNFCKAYALLVLAVGIIIILFKQLCNAFMIAYLIIGLINVYAFFTYIGDLNATKCTCAVDKQPTLNVVMRVYRWVVILGGVSAFMQLLGLLGIGGAKITASK
jgi:hypothetical protein